jgi:hypothetical protein
MPQNLRHHFCARLHVMSTGLGVAPAPFTDVPEEAALCPKK